MTSVVTPALTHSSLETQVESGDGLLRDLGCDYSNTELRIHLLPSLLCLYQAQGKTQTYLLAQLSLLASRNLFYTTWKIFAKYIKQNDCN